MSTGFPKKDARLLKYKKSIFQSNILIFEKRASFSGIPVPSPTLFNTMLNKTYLSVLSKCDSLTTTPPDVAERPVAFSAPGFARNASNAFKKSDMWSTKTRNKFISQASIIILSITKIIKKQSSKTLLIHANTVKT